MLDLNGADPVVFHAMRLGPKFYPLEDAARRFERLSTSTPSRKNFWLTHIDGLGQSG